MNAKKTRTAALYGCVTVAYGFWLYMKVEMSKEQYIEYKQFPVSWVMIGLCGLVGIVVATWQAKLGECNVFRRSNGQIKWSRVIGVCVNVVILITLVSVPALLGRFGEVSGKANPQAYGKIASACFTIMAMFRTPLYHPWCIDPIAAAA